MTGLGIGDSKKPRHAGPPLLRSPNPQAPNPAGSGGTTGATTMLSGTGKPGRAAVTIGFACPPEDPAR